MVAVEVVFCSDSMFTINVDGKFKGACSGGMVVVHKLSKLSEENGGIELSYVDRRDAQCQD